MRNHEESLLFSVSLLFTTNVYGEAESSESEIFTISSEDNWLGTNAQKYGFIIRYQSNKTKTTGYQAEPWHIRHVGKKKQGNIS